MFEAKDILPLLGIPGTKIKSFNSINDGDETTNDQMQTLIYICYRKRCLIHQKESKRLRILRSLAFEI